jgi:hypothetical protein
MKFWVKDPVTDIPSVSLTLMVVTFVGVIVAGALNMAEVVKNTSLFGEIFYSSCALYFGRRLSFGGKNFSSEKAEEITKKVSE